MATSEQFWEQLSAQGDDLPSQGEAQRVRQGAADFRSSAQQGDFAVNPERGTKMIRDYDDAIFELKAEKNRNLDILNRKPKLGTSPDAQVIADFDKRVASGDERALENRLNEMIQVLEDVKAGIQEAMKHYQDTDENNAGGFRQA